MSKFLRNNTVQVGGTDVDFKFGGNSSDGVAWFKDAAQINTGEDHVPSMEQAFRQHHGDMFSLLDRKGDGNINLRHEKRSNHALGGMVGAPEGGMPPIMGATVARADDTMMRPQYATGGAVDTTSAQPNWTQGAQALKTGGSVDEMKIDWSNGQLGRRC